MVKHMQLLEIIQLRNEGMKIKDIAKKLKLCRQTVAKYCRVYNELRTAVDKNPEDEEAKENLQYFLDNGMKRGKQRRAGTVWTPEIEEIVVKILDEEEERLSEDVIIGSEHPITGWEIFEILCEDHNFEGCYSTVSHHVATLRQEEPKKGRIRQKYLPGENMQFDYGSLNLILAGEDERIHLAVGVLSDSLQISVHAYRTEKMETFTDALPKMFEDFEGSTKSVTFDNCKPVVKNFVGGGDKEYTKEVLGMGVSYRFAILTTNPRSGWEKGKVERSVGLIKDKLFRRRREFKDMEDLQNYLAEEVAAYNEKHREKFENEKKYLQPLPATRYESGKTRTGRVSVYGVVTNDYVNYSVPDKLVGKKVTLRIYPSRIKVYYNDELVAQHERLYGGTKEEPLWSMDYRHHIHMFLNQPGGIPGSEVLWQYPQLRRICAEHFTIDGLPDLKAFARFLYWAGTGNIPAEELEGKVREYKKELTDKGAQEPKSGKVKVANQSKEQIRKAQYSIFIGGRNNDK